MYVGDSGRSCTCSGWSRIFREKQLVIKNFICKKSRLEAFPIHLCWSCEKGSRVGRAALTEPRSRCTTSSKRRTRELKSSGKALSFLGEERFLILIYQTVVKEKEKKYNNGLYNGSKCCFSLMMMMMMIILFIKTLGFF